MTKQDQLTLISQLKDAVTALREENNNFRKDVNEQVTAIKEHVDKKHSPIYLEKDILAAVQTSFNKAIEQTLSGYNSPLLKLITYVVDAHSEQLRNILNKAFSTAIDKEEFKNSIISAFSHKVAKTIISNNDGLFDKVHNELKQDSVFKAKAHLAIANVVEELLKEKRNGDSSRF